MGIFRYYSPMLVLFITACTSNPKTMADRDKAEIFEVILSSNDFTSEVARDNDTIYFLENKLTGEFWPSKISKLNIKYIPATGTARSKNGRWVPDERKDERLRFEIKAFDLSVDSAYVMIYHYNFVMDCHYKLKRQSEEWVIKLASCGSE